MRPPSPWGPGVWPHPVLTVYLGNTHALSHWSPAFLTLARPAPSSEKAVQRANSEVRTEETI